MYRPLYVEVDVEGIKRREWFEQMPIEGRNDYLRARMHGFTPVYEIGKPRPVRYVVV